MKRRVEDLAVWGQPPSFPEPLHVGRPNIGDRTRLLERINDLLDRRWLTNAGPYVHEFESRVAAMLGVKHCIAVCNGTVALEIAIRATGLSGEVIVPSFTFVATAHALRWLGITPVFCDVNPYTHTLDPAHVESLISPRTTAILGVHLWGRPCDIDALTNIAQRHQVKLLFDAAHAFGCSYRGTMVGNFGDMEVLSFHATKVCNAFEGGAIVTNDDALAASTQLMRNFGFADYDDVVSEGTNGKMSEVSAAMGITSLESFDDFVSCNYTNYKAYRRELDAIPGISLVAYQKDDMNNYHYITIEVDEEAVALGRDELQQVLWAENVRARRYFYPSCHHMAPYRALDANGTSLPNTDRLAQRVLSLPTGMVIHEQDIAEICQIIRLAVTHGYAVRERLQASIRPLAQDQ